MIKGPLIQVFGGQHLCTACGTEHINCCGLCIEYDPSDYGFAVPCQIANCPHKVCRQAKEKGDSQQ